MKLTEEQLRQGIINALAKHGNWTPSLEKNLFEEITAQTTTFNCVNFADGEERCEKQCKYCERVKGF
jgi:hypothetical protein